VLTLDERNLLIVAYKNSITSKRNAWRILDVQEKNSKKESTESLKRITDYKHIIEDEISVICKDILGLVETILLPSTKETEDIVFYLKVKADYNRYICEFSIGEIKLNASYITQETYQKAYDLAIQTMTPTNPLRLGVALNFSVFYYDILLKQDKACETAKKAFDDAITNLDNAKDDDCYKDATLIIQLLRDNLTLWTSDVTEDTVNK
jgi:14-3-3 protein epsilon